MMAKLAAFVYLLLALGVGWWIARSFFWKHRGWLNRVAASWAFITFLLFFVSNPMIFFVMAAGVLWALRPKNDLAAVAYYLAMLPVVPAGGIGWVIPFPGLESLYTVSFTDLLSLVILLPIILSKPDPNIERNDDHRLVKRVMVIALGFVMLASLLDFRLTTPTNGMRTALSHLLNEGIVIMALARVALLPGALSALSRGILASCFFMLLVGFAHVVTGWFLYSEIPSSLRLGILRYDLVMMSRDGVLRIWGTQGPIPHGIFMVFGMAFCTYFYFEDKNAARPRSLMFMLLCYTAFSISLFQTVSRGAYLMALVALMAALLFYPKLKTARRAFFIPMFFIGSAVMLISGYFMDLLLAEEHGTFMYRWELILNSMDSISRHPLLGTPDFLNNPVLEQSRQGEGLIDIVNAYLGVILRYGVLGLFLYILPLWISVRSLLNNRRYSEIIMSYDAERRARIVLAVVIGFAVAIFTVSLVGILAQYYWVVIFLALAAVASGDEAPSWPVGVVRRGGHHGVRMQKRLPRQRKFG